MVLIDREETKKKTNQKTTHHCKIIKFKRLAVKENKAISDYYNR